jgi:hypothetical protein
MDEPVKEKIEKLISVNLMIERESNFHLDQLVFWGITILYLQLSSPSGRILSKLLIEKLKCFDAYAVIKGFLVVKNLLFGLMDMSPNYLLFYLTTMQIKFNFSPW